MISSILDKGNVTFSVTDNRERYTKVALALIFPFQTLDNLKDGHTGMHWNKFIILQNSYQLSKSGFQILQNIQDQLQWKKLKRFHDMLFSETQEPEAVNSLQRPNGLDDEDDEDFGISADQMAALLEVEDYANGLKNVDSEEGMRGRTFKVLCEKSQIPKSMLVPTDSRDDSVFVSGENDILDKIDDNKGDDSSDNNTIDQNSEANQIHSVIEFVTGALLSNSNGANTASNWHEPDLMEEVQREIMPMETFAAMNNLDDKQTKAFQVVCCTFMLDCLEKMALKYGIYGNQSTYNTEVKLPKEFYLKHQTIVQRKL